MHPLPHRHRSRLHGSHISRITAFPVYLARRADHVPDIEMMMERHRVLHHPAGLAWIEHLTIQRVAEGFMLYAKLVDAMQMSHHPEYESWKREALPLDEALGTGWSEINRQEAREMLDDAGA
jgi:hypothetical protein